MRKSLGIVFMLSLLLLSGCAKKADGKNSDVVSGVQSGLSMDDFAQKFGLNEPVVPENESRDITVVLSGTDCEALLDFFCAAYLEPGEDPVPIEEFQYLLGETSFFLPWILGGCRDGDIGWSEIADMQAAAQKEVSVLLVAENVQKLYKSYWQKKTAAGEEPLSFADFQTALQTDSDFVTSLPSFMASGK